MKYAPPIGQEAQGEEAHYVDGNPELGILGSPVPAAAIEQGQRELLHVIKQAGLTPSSEDLTQLFQAIGKLISNKVPIASKETAGIVKPGAGLQIGEDGTLNDCKPPSDGQPTDATGGSQAHAHALSGEAGKADTLPPYYALSFVMRCA